MQIGIKILSKSAKGKTSIIMAQRPIIRLTRQLQLQQKVAIKTAVKQARLPATVLPWAPGMVTLPINFPTRLASPSPKESAKIPTRAQSHGRSKAAIRIPKTNVTGPRTNLFSSRLRAAISVTFEMTGTLIP